MKTIRIHYWKTPFGAAIDNHRNVAIIVAWQQSRHEMSEKNRCPKILREC